MPSSRVRSPRLPRRPSSLYAVVTLLLGGCSDPPGANGSTGSTSATGPEPPPLTGTGSPSTGVADGTGTSGSSGGGTTGGSQSCCAAHSQPGCDDPELATCVCEQEAFCCAFGWDAECVDLATQCGGCGATTTSETTTGGPEPSACCMAQPGPGCDDDPALETCVCALDDYCCKSQWDEQCVQEAVRQCGAACGGMGGDACCMPAGTPGCPEDPAVEACVCALDAFCCDEQWDGMCAQLAQDDCGLVCMGAEGDCCTAHGAPGCDDMVVSDCVCALDDYCCDVEWDGICVSEAEYVCMAGCGLPPANMGDCCMAQPGPGCGDMAVTECTCMVDGGCCLFPWDDQCVAIAVTACGIACEGVEPLDPCCLPQRGPGCGDMDVESCVCDFDQFCCDTQWDGQCVGEAEFACMLDCGGGGGGGTGTGGSSSTG